MSEDLAERTGYNRMPPAEWDRLETLRAQVAGAARSVERAGYEGALDPAWAFRICEALGRALSLCDRARIAGAVLPVCTPREGASVIVHGSVPQPLPTEPERRTEEASWLGRR